ncbi:MAG: hypothetical protein U0S50_16155 [Sphingopyxis sp.]|uniref:hypothetical protein n=1 Tax=Sphingopyxis sp. TaxID=1908224 RepID=UPI002AB99D52|nr:hypothetical protein [Sphingopyxis sp.]MDZ3833329.1 hypothetical protein [Sphingopyxis sp.]
MNDEAEDVLDALLREHFEGPVPDEGFCARVVDRLPARRRRNNWPMAAGILAGVAACWFSLWSDPITSAGWRDWLSGYPSTSTMTLLISMMSMTALALAWTIAEADDRYGGSSRLAFR